MLIIEAEKGKRGRGWGGGGGGGWWKLNLRNIIINVNLNSSSISTMMIAKSLYSSTSVANSVVLIYNGSKNLTSRSVLVCLSPTV